MVGDVRMSERTYNKFEEALTALFYDYKTDYDEFTKKGVALLEKAQKHREISDVDYMRLLDELDNMCSYLACAFIED